VLLGRLRVRQKLVLLVVPLLLLAVAGAVPLVLSRIQAAERSNESARLVQRAVRITELVQELQQERLASLGYLSNDVPRDDVVARSTRVLELARQIGTDYGAGDDKLSLELRQVTLRSGLDGLRPQILDQRVPGIGVYTGFTGVIDGLIDQLRLTVDADLRSNAGRQQVALDAIIRHDEATASESSALFIEPRRQITMRVVGLVGGGLALENREESVFKQLADPSAADLYERVEASKSSTRLNNYLDGLVGSNATQISATIAADLAPQVESLTSLSRLVETRVAAQAVAEADRSARADRFLAGTVGGIALVLLIAAALLSVLITRSIARPLRRLTASADEVADVAQLELVRVADTDDPEAAVPQLRPVRVGTADELGELAQAFNRVQQVASSLVERQLVSRQNVATMFGNVGRRTQNLVGRQLAMIDSLERNEQDPALLDRLYRLDHVSTRLRRNANSLVVLSGATEQQITSEPLSVADTIRSALGEIEGFQRVRLGSVGDAVLAPDVTSDVILLLAELLENGTSFSPPHTDVEVEARTADDGDVLIRIVDHGLGMTSEQLEAENARLVSRERLDLAPTDVLGLFVAGRLARRHGIAVRLLPTPGTGVTAEVRIPELHVVRSDRPAPAAAAEPDEAAGAPVAGVTPETPVGPAVAALDGRGWWDSPTPSDAPSRAVTPPAPNGSRGAEPPASHTSNGDVPAADGVMSAAAAAELAAAAGAARAGGADEPAPDLPRPRGAAGMVRRIRGAQHPDTGVRDEQPAFPAPSADDARQDIEEFEAGVRRALRETGADGGSGFVIEDDVAPWTDLDADDPEGTEQTRVLVEEFEDGVRRALARLDQVTGRPSGPSAVFERRPGFVPIPGGVTADPRPLERRRTQPAQFRNPVPPFPPVQPPFPPAALPPFRTPAASQATGDAATTPTESRTTETWAAGAWAAGARAAEARAADVRAVEAGPGPSTDADGTQQAAAADAGGIDAWAADGGAGNGSNTDGVTADGKAADGAGAAATGAAATGAAATGAAATGIAAAAGAGAARSGEARSGAATSGAATSGAATSGAATSGDATFAAARSGDVTSAAVRAGAGDAGSAAAGLRDGADADAAEAGPPAGSPDAAARRAGDTTGTAVTTGTEAAAEAAGADGPTGSEQTGAKYAQAAVGGLSGSGNGVVGKGKEEPAAEGERDGEHPGIRGNGAGPNGRVANDPDEGKMDPSGRGLVRRVPGAQMPAGALGARPGMPAPAQPDTAERDAAAARSLVEEFEAGVQRALRNAPDAADTDEDGVR